MIFSKFFVKILSRLRVLDKLNILMVSQLNQELVYIPVLGSLGKDNLNISELWMCDLLLRLRKFKTGAFVDIGANVGQSLIKLRSIDKMCLYIGFEPNSKCIYYLDALIKANKYQHVRLIPVGLFDKTSILKLNLYSEGATDSSASIITDFRSDKVFGTVDVPVFNFKELYNVFDGIDVAFLKIDVEGAEFEVLESLKNLIVNCQPIILVEILPPYDKGKADRVNRQNKIGDLLRELDYVILRIHKNHSKEKVERLEDLDAFNIHGSIELSDYILVPMNISKNILNCFN